jgi:hypothetical protein
VTAVSSKKIRNAATLIFRLKSGENVEAEFKKPEAIPPAPVALPVEIKKASR